MAPELDGSDIEGDADADEDYSINYPFICLSIDKSVDISGLMNRQTDRLWQRLLYHLLGHQATNEVGKRRTGLFCPTEVDPIISLRPL